MYLSHLALTDFRNYRHLELALGPGFFLFSGENAQGKTNLLEAVAMISTSTSFHASADREVVNWYAHDHLARIEAAAQRRQDQVEVELVVFDPTPPDMGDSTEPGRRIEIPLSAQRKRIKINHVPKRSLDLIGQVTNVLFAPADLHLVDGSPDERRRLLDRCLCQVQPRYCQALQQYRKIITQRAALLKRIRDYQEDPRQLDYLDERLTILASLLLFERQRLIGALNDLAQPLQEEISGGREQLQVVYRPTFKVDPGWSQAEAQPHYRQQLRDARRKEIQQGVCLLGPHRDDLDFLVNGMSMITYGSRGQQRTVALSTKLAELAYMRATTGDEPILLLDDVFSELDLPRRAHLLQAVLQHEQVLLTTTDYASFPPEILARSHTYQVVNGEIHPL
ncbi:MAG: DNA replication/repair protein RecF [Ktedonobacteraceae bacterium]|nr:DNA replication/repair protein RecF [Ktedonobacteraceae bacterium]